MIRTVNHLCCVLGVKEGMIRTILSNIDSYYREKKIEKKKNGRLKLNKEGTPRYRIINPSLNQLYTIQERINRFLTDQIQPSDYAYGATKGRDNVKNAKIHLGKKYIFQTDMQDFFPFITHKMVYAMFVRHGFSCDISSILTKLTTFEGHLPQGASTSATIANLVFAETGDKITDICKKSGLYFTTFVDDVTISAPFDFKDKTPNILEMIKAGGFKISHPKTTYKTDHPIITGVKLGNNYLDVTDKFKAKLLVTEGKTEAQIQGERNYQKKVLKSNKCPLKSGTPI